MGPRPEPKLQPQSQPMLLAGMMPPPSSPKPPASFGGYRITKGIAFAILPIALLGYAVFASGLVSFPAGKQDVVHSVAAAEPSNSAIKADQDEGETLGRIGIGLRLVNLTPNVIKSLGLQTNRPQGVVITEVMPRSSADRVGFIKGDIILAVDDTPVSESDELITKINYTPINQNVTVIFERGGVTQAVQVKVGCRRALCWNSIWRNLQRHEVIGSGGEVNWVIDSRCGKGLPAVDLAHVDLAGGEQGPEQHASSSSLLMAARSGF